MPTYNVANIRISKDEESSVNGVPYIDVARSYYNSNMYADEQNVIDGLSDDIIPVFNAVPKVVNIATSLAVGGEIEPSYEDSEWVSNVIDKLALEQEKIFMTRDLILGKSILVEVQSREFSSEDEVEDAYNQDDFPYELAYYPSSDYELVSEGQRILWAKIKGIKLRLNEEGTEYEEVEVDKIFIRKDDGTAESYVLEGEEKSEEIVYDDGILPLVEITTTYDMKQLFYSVDRHNELEHYIRNILYLAGEPILAGIGLDRISTQTADTINADKYRKLKAMFTKSEQAKIQMIEIQGTSARIMIEKQRELVGSIIKDYPEYSISDVLAGSNVSEETTRIRLTEILSRVSEVRRNMEIGINKIIGLVAFLDGKEIQKRYIAFGNPNDSSLKETLDTIIIALQNNLISRRSAMYQIKNLFIGEDLEAEIAEILSPENKELSGRNVELEKESGDNGDRQGNTDSANSSENGDGN